MKTELFGLVDGIPIEEYHRTDGLSSTGVGYMLEAPAVFKWHRDNPDQDDDTEAKYLGSLVHEAILEPVRFGERYVHIKGAMSKNPFKQQADEAKAAGKVPVGDTMYLKTAAMRDAALSNARVRALLNGAAIERSAFWKDPEYGFLSKCRPDAFRIKEGIVTDFKTIAKIPTVENMKRAIRDYKYHIKAKWYLDGLSEITGEKLTKFIHVFICSQAPHLINFCALSDEDLARSGMIIAAVRKRYAECLATDTWPGVEEGIQTLTMDYFDYPELPSEHF